MGIELSYGFLGYRSGKYLEDSTDVKEEGRTGAWGFNGETGWGNGLELGVNVSF